MPLSTVTRLMRIMCNLIACVDLQRPRAKHCSGFGRIVETHLPSLSRLSPVWPSHAGPVVVAAADRGHADDAALPGRVRRHQAAALVHGARVPHAHGVRAPQPLHHGGGAQQVPGAPHGRHARHPAPAAGALPTPNPFSLCDSSARTQQKLLQRSINSDGHFAAMVSAA
jgi:hypothetical protein